MIAAALVLAACQDGEEGLDADAEEGLGADAEEGLDADADEGLDADADEEEDWPDNLVFSTGLDPEDQTLEASWAAMARLFEDELGIDVEFVQISGYAATIEGFISGTVQLADAGSFGYVVAMYNDAPMVPVATFVSGPDDDPGYTAIGFGRPDRDVNSMADMAGKDVCFVDPGSTSGYLLPAAGLLDVNVDPESDLNPIFSGQHDAAITAVAQGDCDAGFSAPVVYGPRMEQLIEDGVAEDGDVEIVWESPLIPSPPIVVHADLPDSLISAIQEMLLENNGDTMYERGLCEGDEVTQEGPTGNPACLFHTDQWGFVPIADEDFDGIREVCELTNAPACEAD